MTTKETGAPQEPEKKAPAAKAEPKGPVIKARYVGDGKQIFIGVPARDLTEDEFNALDPLQRRDVEAGTIYEVAAGDKGGAN